MRDLFQALDSEQNLDGMGMLVRVVSMLTKSGRRDRGLREKPAVRGDYDYDNDNDNEEGGESEQADVPDARSSRQ